MINLHHSNKHSRFMISYIISFERFFKKIDKLLKSKRYLYNPIKIF